MPERRTQQLVQLLLLMTVVTGLVDATSYLALGHVFVANMTGNVVFLGFAWGGDRTLSASASAVSMLAFLVGALAGGELATRRGAHRGRHLVAGASTSLGLLVLALVVAVAIDEPYQEDGKYTLVSLLALAMGVQNATARALAVPDATTTVLTMTLTGLAADTRLTAGRNPRVLRRVTSVLAMLLGALCGALIVERVNAAWALGAAVVLMSVITTTAHLVSRGTAAESWTATTLGAH